MTEKNNKETVYVFVKLWRGLHDYTVVARSAHTVEKLEQDFLEIHGFENKEEYEQSPCDDSYYLDKVEIQD